MQNLRVVCKHRWKYKVRWRCDCSGLVCSSFRRASSSSRCFYKNSWGPLRPRHTEHTEKNITKFRILWRVYTSKAVSFCKNTVLTLKTWSSHQAMMSWCFLNKKKDETEIQSTFSFKRDRAAGTISQFGVEAVSRLLFYMCQDVTGKFELMLDELDPHERRQRNHFKDHLLPNPAVRLVRSVYPLAEKWTSIQNNEYCKFILQNSAVCVNSFIKNNRFIFNNLILYKTIKLS